MLRARTLSLFLLLLFLASPSAWSASAPAQEEKTLLAELESAQDGYEVGSASRKFADLRTPSAMEARIALYDDKMDIRGGVHLRDWLYSGMTKAEAASELEVLAEAAASKRNSELLRLVCLRAVRRSSAPIEAELLLDKALLKLEGRLGRAWQAAVGEVLAKERLTHDSKSKHRDALRVALLEQGMPFLGFRQLAPRADEMASMLESFQRSKDPGDRAQFLYVLAPHASKDLESLTAYMQVMLIASHSAHRAERVALWASALEHRVYDAAPLLIQALAQMEGAPPSRHLRDLGAALRALTGKQFGDNSEAWQRWWDREGVEWLKNARQQNETGSQRDSPTEDDDTIAQYFGIPIDSDRIGFVLDGSGSMNDELADGRKCSEAAATELVQFLESFPEEGVLNLRVIVRESESPFKQPVTASKKNRTRAIRFVEQFDFGPASSMYDVLLEAQADSEIDTLLFVSDGGGSWGSFAYAGHMLDGLRLAYERSGVRIHCICVGNDRNKVRFMEQLADLTSGRMQKI